MSSISQYHQKLLNDFSDEGYDRTLTTRNWYGSRLRPYLEFLEIKEVTLANSGPSEIKRYLTTLRDAERSWSTRNGTHTALDVFYEWLVTRSHIQKNPFQIEEIKRPRKTTKIQELIELEVLQTLFDTLRRDDSVMARRDYALILLLFDTGLRRTEAASINISDVKFDRGNIIVRKAKRDNDRIVPFNEPLQKVLQNWLDVHPNKNSDNLFVTLRGEFKGLSPRRVNGILVRWLRIAELKNGEQVTPHGLRRAFATYFSDSGGDMFILKDILGHSKIETTKAYVINTGKRLKQQHQKYSPLKLLTLD